MFLQSICPLALIAAETTKEAESCCVFSEKCMLTFKSDTAGNAFRREHHCVTDGVRHRVPPCIIMPMMPACYGIFFQLENMFLRVQYITVAAEQQHGTTHMVCE